MATTGCSDSQGQLSDVELHKLLQQLDVAGKSATNAALARLSKAAWKKDHVTSFRLGGYINILIPLLEITTASDTLHDALTVLLTTAEHDVACKDALIKGGAVRRLCKLLDPASCQESAVVLLSLRLLHQCINSGDIERAPAVDELFRVGAASKATRFLEGDDSELAQAAGNLFWEITDITGFREHCRDLGIIPTVLKLLASNPDVAGYMGIINNLSRSEALHLTLQEYGVIDVLATVLSSTTLEVNRTQALLTVAHVYAGQEGHVQSDSLLSKYDATLSVMTMMEACLHGDSMFGGAWWALEEVVQAVQSLTQTSHHAERLWKAGVIDLLIEVLTEHTDDSDAVFQTLRAVANLASVPSLTGRVQQKKQIAEAAQAFQESEDLRVQDAAKSALLQLGALKDDHPHEDVLAADSALSGDQRDYQQKYDVFLSHKRTDSKDFARALYNLLVVRSFKTFLDYEYREELSDLGQIVANSANLVFIMTDNIFDSPWCIRELEAAVEAKINIILLVKEGSRWKNGDGLKICEFPGENILGKLPAKLQKVFTRKAVYHSDEYYQTFVEMLVKKIIRVPDGNKLPRRQVWPEPSPAASAPSLQPAGSIYRTTSNSSRSSAVQPIIMTSGPQAGALHTASTSPASWPGDTAPQQVSSSVSHLTGHRAHDGMYGGVPASAALPYHDATQPPRPLPWLTPPPPHLLGGMQPAVVQQQQHPTWQQPSVMLPLLGASRAYTGGSSSADAGSLLLVHDDLAVLRRDLLAVVQDVRREIINEIHQLKLDFNQQLQQVRRESDAVLNEVLQRLREIQSPAGRLQPLPNNPLGQQHGFQQQQPLAAVEPYIMRQVEVLSERLQRLSEHVQGAAVSSSSTSSSRMDVGYVGSHQPSSGDSAGNAGGGGINMRRSSNALLGIRSIPPSGSNHQQQQGLPQIANSRMAPAGGN